MQYPRSGTGLPLSCLGLGPGSAVSAASSASMSHASSFVRSTPGASSQVSSRDVLAARRFGRNTRGRFLIIVPVSMSSFARHFQHNCPAPLVPSRQHGLVLRRPLVQMSDGQQLMACTVRPLPCPISLEREDQVRRLSVVPAWPAVIGGVTAQVVLQAQTAESDDENLDADLRRQHGEERRGGDGRYR
ncbi:hypothetical protein BN1708_013342 [Verticillium longisporum]|uniref:Uncharacterized protein n=2 Tax=Verticillium longisporum TaxID=100787 RepID=A0A0G4LJM3_VERLO|nr:hypothetical protein BN1708_013342 [Verticillium longisporum]